MHTTPILTMGLSGTLANLAAMQPVAIERASVGMIDGRLQNPFVIASDSSKVKLVENLMVTVETEDGFVGIGEAAPYPGISRDSFDVLKSDLKRTIPELLGRRMTPLRFVAQLKEIAKWPAARAALEMAYLDAYASRMEIGLFNFLDPNAEKRELETDITIPIVEAGAASVFAADYRSRGFGRIKIKVGDDVTAAVNRIEAVIGAYVETGDEVDLELLLDANEGYNADKAILLLWHLRNRTGFAPSIFEQPVRRDDIAGLQRVREVAREYGTRVYADESVFTVEDAISVIERDAVDGINLKLMKHGGLIESYRIGEIASAAGLEIMIGGMVESKIAMTASLHLAHVLDVEWLDLDTPLLMDVKGLAGGMIYRGARVMLPETPGIGVVRIEEVRGG